MLVASREDNIDFEATAALGTLAFENPSVILTGDHLRWFYEKSYSLGATVIGLKDDGVKVGQIAMVKQSVMMGGKQEEAAQLVDLFIEKSHRGKRALTLLYEEVGKQFEAQKIRFAFGMPNAKAVRVNEHFFQLKPFLSLKVRIGFSLPLTPNGLQHSIMVEDSKRALIIALADRYKTPADENGLAWDGAKLFNRLCAKKFQYGIHATENLLLISSPRETRGVKYTLFCGFLRNPAAKPHKTDMNAVIRAACSMWGRRVFIYAGHYEALPSLPGMPFPKRIHHSPMLLQVRDFFPERGKFGVDRFQLIDFDFA